MTSHNDPSSRHTTLLPWLTLPAAAMRLERATNGEVTTQDQLLQLCADGALPLTLRLEVAAATAWGPASGHWWRQQFRRGDAGANVVYLSPRPSARTAPSTS